MLTQLEIRNCAGYITLNRPEKRNALSQALLEDFRQSLANMKAAGVNIAILQGAGPVFCAGVDLAELDTGSELVRQFSHAMRDAGVLWVALVDKPVMGGGLSLLQSCAVVLASPEAVFVLPEVNKGFFPRDMVGNLGALVGLRRLMWMAVSGAHLSAAEALAAGLVSEVASRDVLEKMLESLISNLGAGDLAVHAAQCWESACGDLH